MFENFDISFFFIRIPFSPYIFIVLENLLETYRSSLRLEKIYKHRVFQFCLKKVRQFWREIKDREVSLFLYIGLYDVRKDDN